MHGSTPVFGFYSPCQPRFHVPHTDSVPSDFQIGKWDPYEAASVPTWNPTGRMPAGAAGGVGDPGKEKPPEEALPHISFDVPPAGARGMGWLFALYLEAGGDLPRRQLCR